MLWLAGCNSSEGATVDTSSDGGNRIPIDSKPCETDVDCQDDIDCTREACHPLGYCEYVEDTAQCSDGIFCNGTERCDRKLGCVSVPRQACNDEDVCTIDRCNEEQKRCEHAPRDFDQDGDVDWHCEGGTDCDDQDPIRGGTTAEVCSDGVDNDCDGTTDEASCGRPPHDTCEDALDISAGGSFVLRTRSALPDYATRCSLTANRDAVATFRLSEPRSVEISAVGSLRPTLALRTACTESTSEIECVSHEDARIRTRELPPGQYWLIVSDSVPGDIDIAVRFSEPLPQATNESCEAPEALAVGEQTDLSLVDAVDDLQLSGCGESDAGELVYSFDVDETSDVSIEASSTGGPLAIALQSACGGSVQRCGVGVSSNAVLRGAKPGKYYVIVEDIDGVEPDASLLVSLSEPSPAVAGDLCEGAIEVPLGTEVTGTLADKENDYETSCVSGYRDAVYFFELAKRQDVTVKVDAGAFRVAAALQKTCGDDGSQLRCHADMSPRLRLRSLDKGTYYVIVEASSGPSTRVSVEATDPLSPTTVSGNGSCESAQTIGESGGLFQGTTTDLGDKYLSFMCNSVISSPDAFFKLTLATTKNVIISTEGSSFRTEVSLISGACSVQNERACDDEAGDGNAGYLERKLDPGTYFIVVDGKDGARGDYTLEVLTD